MGLRHQIGKLVRGWHGGRAQNFPTLGQGSQHPRGEGEDRWEGLAGGRSEGPSSQCVTLTLYALVCWRERGHLRPLASLFPLGLPTQDALPSAYPGGYSAGKACRWVGVSSK